MFELSEFDLNFILLYFFNLIALRYICRNELARDEWKTRKNDENSKSEENKRVQSVSNTKNYEQTAPKKDTPKSEDNDDGEKNAYGWSRKQVTGLSFQAIRTKPTKNSNTANLQWRSWTRRQRNCKWRPYRRGLSQKKRFFIHKPIIWVIVELCGCLYLHQSIQKLRKKVSK